MEKPSDEFLASGYSSISPETLTPRNALNKSYTISKHYYEDKKLSVICEENSECGNDSNMSYLKSIVSITDSSECKNMSFADLGTKQISASPEFKMEMNDNIEEYYDSDESLGILPGLLEDLTYDDFNLHKDDLIEHLNTSVNISDKLIGNFEDSLKDDPKCSCKEFFSPVGNKINISDTQAESPVYHSECMPQHASTPKHENSNIIEEITSPQNMHDFYINKISQDHNEEENDCLNKTTIIETNPNYITNIPTSTSLNSNENMNSQQNILNITCNMIKPINTNEVSLNKTFESLPVIADKHVLPSVICDSEQYKINKSNILDTTFELHYSELDPGLGKENLVNVTSCLGKGSNTIGTVCEFSENAKNSTRDILNTTLPYPSVHDETRLTCGLSKNKSNVNIDQNNFQARTGDILNTTFEKIEDSFRNDANSEKLKCITNLEENKFLQLGTKTVIKKRRTSSFSAKHIAPEKIEFKSKVTEFDRNKNLRRSFGCFGTNVSRPSPIKQTCKISNASSNCSVTKVPEIKKNLSFPKSSPKHAGNIENKSNLIQGKNEVNMNSAYLKNKTVKCMPLRLSESKSRNIESLSKMKPKGIHQLLRNTTASFHPTSDVDRTVKCSSKNSNGKSEDIKSVSKVNLKGSQESLLNTTINLPLPITDACKTVIKKPRKSMQIRNAIESGTYELPFSFHPTSDLDRTVKCSSRFSNGKSEDIKSVFEINLKDNQESLLNTTINLSPPVTDAFKTVIKKPRKSMQISNAIESVSGTCELPFKKDIKSVIPLLQKRVATKVSQVRVEGMTQEEKKISRLPQQTFSQKTKFQSGCQSSSIKPSSDISKPQSITGIRLPATGRKSLYTVTKKSSNKESELAGKAISKGTLSSQKSKEQGTEIIQPPTTGRKSPFSLNGGSETAGKAISKDTVSSQKNKEQDTETHKKFQIPTKIPTVSLFSQRDKTYAADIINQKCQYCPKRLYGKSSLSFKRM